MKRFLFEKSSMIPKGGWPVHFTLLPTITLMYKAKYLVVYFEWATYSFAIKILGS